MNEHTIPRQMHLEVVQSSSYLAPLLPQILRVTVHSIYQQTVNILYKQQLIALQTAHSPLSPLSVITPYTAEQLATFAFQPHEELDCFFHFQPTSEIYCSQLPAFTLPQMVDFDHLAEQLLQQSKPKGLHYTLQQNRDFTAEYIQRQLQACWQAYIQQDYATAAAHLVRVLGVGIGLTPSGDDFLCGVLAGLNAAAAEQPFRQMLHEQIYAQLSRTNDISRAFLECALKGQFSSAVVQFFQHPFATAAQQQWLLQQFEAIGHSSGLDTLSGIAFISRLFSEQPG